MTIEEANIRDNIIFGEDFDEKKYLGGVRKFDCLDGRKLGELIDEGFIEPKEGHNLSPWAEDYWDFINTHPDSRWYLNGYAVSPERDDCRVSITGIETHDIYDKYTLMDFVHYFRLADDIDIDAGHLYCWFD